SLSSPSHTLFFLLPRPPPISTLFPYTTLFRSRQFLDVDHGNVVRTAHRNECRLAVSAEPDVRAALADRQPLHLFEGPRVEDLGRSEEHTSELQSRFDLVCRLLLEKKKYNDHHG